MSHERKIDMIRVVAAIMESFVDREFGTASEQILLEKTRIRLTVRWRNAVDSPSHIIPTFNDAADEDAARKSTA